MSNNRKNKYRTIRTLEQLREEQDNLDMLIEASTKGLKQQAQHWMSRGSQLIIASMAARMFDTIANILGDDRGPTSPQEATAREAPSEKRSQGPHVNVTDTKDNAETVRSKASGEQGSSDAPRHDASNAHTENGANGHATNLDNVVSVLDKIAFTVNTLQTVAHQFQETADAERSGYERS